MPIHPAQTRTRAVITARRAGNIMRRAAHLAILPMATGLFAGASSGETRPPPDVAPALQPATARTEPRWGVGMGLRYADVPFRGGDDTVADIVPLFFFEGRHVFLRGLEGGLHAWTSPQTEINLLARYRFFDIPKGLQNEIRQDALDMGAQLRWQFKPGWRLDGEVLSDVDGRVQGIARLGAVIGTAGWRFQPEAELRAKTAAFNSNYYGIGEYDVDAGADLRFRLKMRRHVYRNLYLIGSAEAAFLDHAARSSPAVNDRMEWEAFLGVGFFNRPVTPAGEPQALSIRPYWRLSQGIGTDATILEAMTGEVAAGDRTIRMTSLFYGYPLAENFMGLPIEVYLTPGLAHHYASSAQDAATEYVLAVKFYHTLPLPWRVRLGFAEGMSYADSITYYEETSLTRKGYRTSRLLNYLDFSLDVSLGDMTKRNGLRDWWLGAGIHHRSGIFETASMFGRIKGGSNFSTVYLQWSP
ncbi:MipA/OmpV family protein [Termitidicoccus mucosus]|uniref:MipA/OmpV family protein n=1 Tax=Termitidicoccus mucosus TaxID=1184151 RepID=UPI002FEE1B42